MDARWLSMRSEDIDEVLNTERLSYVDPWSFRDLRTARQCANVVDKVVRSSCGRYIGHILFSRERSVLRLLTLCVHPDSRRQGYGSWMLTRMTAFGNNRYRWAVCDIREDNLTAQVWLRANGWYCDGPRIVGGDSYRFLYAMQGNGNVRLARTCPDDERRMELPRSR